MYEGGYLLDLILVIVFSSVFGATYSMLTGGGELLSFIPNYARRKTKNQVLIKLSYCGKCWAGWISILIFLSMLNNDWTEPITYIWFLFVICTSMLLTAIINIHINGS